MAGQDLSPARRLGENTFTWKTRRSACSSRDHIRHAARASIEALEGRTLFYSLEGNLWFDAYKTGVYDQIPDFAIETADVVLSYEEFDNEGITLYLPTINPDASGHWEFEVDDTWLSVVATITLPAPKAGHWVVVSGGPGLTPFTNEMSISAQYPYPLKKS